MPVFIDAARHLPGLLVVGNSSRRHLTLGSTLGQTELGIKLHLIEMYLSTFQSICSRIVEDFRDGLAQRLS